MNASGVSVLYVALMLCDCPRTRQHWFPLEGGGAQYEDGYEHAEEDMVDDLYNLIGHHWAFRVSAG